jgi:hypothetical protein
LKKETDLLVLERKNAGAGFGPGLLGYAMETERGKHTSVSFPVTVSTENDWKDVTDTNLYSSKYFFLSSKSVEMP